MSELNNRRKITEGTCQNSLWLGSINVPPACFSTQTLKTNSLPTQGSCLDKRWWIPAVEGANRDFMPLPPTLLSLWLIFPCSLPLAHFLVLVSQRENQSFPFRRSWGHIHHSSGLWRTECRINHEHLQQKAFTPGCGCHIMLQSTQISKVNGEKRDNL